MVKNGNAFNYEDGEVKAQEERQYACDKKNKA